VGFRYYARREALRLDLAGWVRNLDSGEVEAWAEGSPDALEEFRSWLFQGPPGAWVSSVEVEKRDPSGRFLTFSIED
jgi:acylphosphatase